MLPEAGLLPPMRQGPSVALASCLNEDWAAVLAVKNKGRVGERTREAVVKVESVFREGKLSKRAKVEWVTEMVGDYEARLEALEDEMLLSVGRCETDAMRREVHHHRKYVITCEATIRALQQKIWQLESLQTSVKPVFEGGADKERERAQAAFMELKRKEQVLKANREAQNERIDELEGKLAALRTSEAQLAKSNIELTDSNNSLEYELANLTVEKETLEAQQQILEEEMDALEKKYKKKIDDLQATLQRLEEAFQEQQDAASTVREKLEEELREEHQIAMLDLTSEKNALQERVDQCEEQVMQLQLLVATLRVKEVTYSNKINELEELMEDQLLNHTTFLKALDTAQEGTLATLKAENRPVEIQGTPDGVSRAEAIHATVKELVVATAQATVLQNELNVVNAKLKVCELELETQKQNLQESERCNAKLMRELEKFGKDNPVLQDAREKARIAADKMKALERKMHVAPDIPDAFKRLLERMETKTGTARAKFAQRKQDLLSKKAQDAEAALDYIGKPTKVSSYQTDTTTPQPIAAGVVRSGEGAQPAAPFKACDLMQRVVKQASKVREKPRDALSRNLNLLHNELLGHTAAEELVTIVLILVGDVLSKPITQDEVAAWLRRNAPQLMPKRHDSPSLMPLMMQASGLGTASNPNPATDSSLPNKKSNKMVSVANRVAKRHVFSPPKAPTRDFATEILGPRLGNKRPV